MAAVLDIMETQQFDFIKAPQVSGTFESLREHLFNQFQNVPFIPETGLSLEELKQEVEAYLQAHSDQPKVLQKANVYRIVVTRGQIYLDPLDWFADKLNHGGLVTKVRDEWYRDVRIDAIKKEAGWFGEVNKLGIIRGGLDMGHISPGWENMFTSFTDAFGLRFSGGLTGLIKQAQQERERLESEATNEQLSFYEAVEMVYQATITLAERFSELAQKMILDFPEHEERLRAISNVCKRVPAYAPETFYEALQFAWLMHEMIEMEGELVRSMGHFDRIFYPYYRADIDSGRLTREQAKELIKFFWFKYYARTRGKHNGKNFVFAGQYADGSILTNELTYLALEAYEELNTPDPKLSVRFLPGTPDELYRRIADLIRNGHNSFVLMNDVPAIEAQVKRGKTWEDARLYLPIGCYEPAVDGKEAACTMNIEINLAKVLELALHNGVDPLSGQQIGPNTGDPREFANFEQMFDAYTRQMDFLLTRTVEYVGAHEQQWPQINPSPLIAGTIDDCLAKGKDIGQGGAHYNAVGCVGIGLANACDSLLGVKKAVFDEKRFTMGEILKAIRCDFEGYEPMRQYLLNKVPKWGNNDPNADAMAKRIADYYCNKVHTFTNARGGPVQAALFTLTTQWSMGKVTGALPDGRKAGESLAPGVGATPGRDMNGATGLIGSVTKLDFTETPNGSVLDVMLHPTAVKGDDGLDAFVTLIKTFFAQGGYALQFNVFDVDTLRDAQRYPERYTSLQIRVTGWSVYFNTLSKFEQDQFIARNIHTM
jgi:formate C-acetyltransferase